MKKIISCSLIFVLCFGGFNICGSVSGFQSTLQTMYYSPLIYAENLGFSLK